MDVLRQISAVLGVLLLAVALAWWARRRGTVLPRRGRRLETMERLVLTPHHSLYLVRIFDRAVVVGLSPSGCQVLESREWRAEEVKTCGG